MLTISSRIHIPLSEIEFTFARSSGPGGQNVNKVNSKAILRWPARASQSLPESVRARLLSKYRTRITSEGHLIITSQRYRDQGRNVSDCLEKLATMLREVATPPVKRKTTKPTKAARERRLQTKQVQSRKKQRRRAVDEE